MSGQNVAPQIAQLKGQKNAVSTVMITKSCAAPPPQAAPTAPATKKS